MSRGKRIVVDEDEWARLQAAARRLRDLNENLPSLLDDVRGAVRRDLDRELSVVADRQSAFEGMLATAGESVRDLERATTVRLDEQTRRMTEQRTALTQRVDTTAAELRQETLRLLDAERARVDDTIARERAERAGQVARLREGLNDLVSDKERAARAARTWLADAAAMRDFIREHLPHERFAPGRLAALEQRIAMAEGNVAAGRSEAAISVAQETYLQLSELRLDLEMRDREWRQARGSATGQLRMVSGLIRDKHLCKGVNQDDTENDSLVEVDWWTSGKLSRLAVEVEDLLEQVADDTRAPGSDELRDLVDRQVPILKQRLQEIAQEAGALQLASQIRANIADSVIQVLQENGYGLDDYTYEGEDYRAMLVAKVRHNDGSEIVIRVAPVPGDPPGCTLDIDSFDTATGSDLIRWERARALAERLREEGIEVREPQESGTPDPAARDVERLRRPPQTRGEVT
ncbi:hypothetical protein [Nonomuraea endophytica]|uniref:Uncharacterized protein n=1 Tax=Nonomuraea endophytica TaxID=714136 RepID=A0A7W8AD02_9ACTN|nr:hypothetical protein [Nonomuraea endophytica]MBB5083820.1 hypothetical protein [Nonomuraea endophytica]